MGLRVGIPRALWYYSYYPFWRTFFESLGAKVVDSGPTSRDTLNMGVDETVSEACVPIKVFVGHVKSLIKRWEKREIDAIFMPRYVNWSGRTVYCPKFLGLPDMIRYSFSDLPKLIEVRLDARRRPLALLRACNTIRKELGAPRRLLLGAYVKALRTLHRHNELLRQGVSPLDSIASTAGGTSVNATSGKVAGETREDREARDNRETPVIRLAVLGYPYLIYDRYVNLGLLDKLKNLGVEVITAECVWPHLVQKEASKFIKNLFWTYSDMVAKAGYYFLDLDANEAKPEAHRIDGIIHITAFGCGPDAMVDKLLELKARQLSKPFLPLTLDEHTGEAGALTRLEAFVDMLKRRCMTAG
ncbi:MAG TPA: 2-hydroxyglutaryl-CoA dehydratase [Firmicutes bacterium]|nr:2-hydroxyglutaryl-CoA dehydratase [Bacillota bacterium]